MVVLNNSKTTFVTVNRSEPLQFFCVSVIQKQPLLLLIILFPNALMPALGIQKQPLLLLISFFLDLHSASASSYSKTTFVTVNPRF